MIMPDSHPEITSIRSREEAHSSLTPGQDAKRTQPGDSSEQGKSASKRLTSISDAHSQRGTCRQSLVCRAPRRCHSYAKHNNFTLNVGTYPGASASRGQSMRGPVANSTWVIGVFNGQPPMPDSHPEITSIRSLVEAHSSVTPGQDAKRTQPGDNS